MDTAYRFAEGTRVRLRDGIDPSFYSGMARVGNEGWIAALRRDDRFGLPEVFIKWDRNHWADNGQPDSWTYEEHFDLVEEPKQMSPLPRNPDDRPPKNFAEFLAAMMGDKREAQPDESNVDEYADRVAQLIEVLGHSEAFIAVAIVRQPDDQAPKGVLIPVGVQGSMTPESLMLAGSQLARLAARHHEELALLGIQHLVGGTRFDRS